MPAAESFVSSEWFPCASRSNSTNGGRLRPKVGPRLARLHPRSTSVGPFWRGWSHLASCWPEVGQFGVELGECRPTLVNLEPASAKHRPSMGNPGLGPPSAPIGLSLANSAKLDRDLPNIGPTFSKIPPGLVSLRQIWPRLIEPLLAICSPSSAELGQIG